VYTVGIGRLLDHVGAYRPIKIIYYPTDTQIYSVSHSLPNPALL